MNHHTFISDQVIIVPQDLRHVKNVFQASAIDDQVETLERTRIYLIRSGGTEPLPVGDAHAGGDRRRIVSDFQAKRFRG